MAIRKFNVNGVDAHVDYRALDNIPCGYHIEEDVYPKKTSTNYVDTGKGKFIADLDVSDLSEIPIPGEDYLVQFDDQQFIKYPEGNSDFWQLYAGPYVDPSNFICIISYDNDHEFGLHFTCTAPTGGEHTLTITKLSLLKLNANYLPKPLEFADDTPETIMEPTAISFTPVE